MPVSQGSVAIYNLDAGFAAQLAKNEEAVDAFLRDVARNVRDDAKRTAAFTDRTGNLRRSIRMRKSKFERGGYIVIATGQNRSKDARGFHALVVEKGHAKVLWGRRTGGKVKGRPFMSKAIERGKAYAAAKISAGAI